MHEQPPVGARALASSVPTALFISILVHSLAAGLAGGCVQRSPEARETVEAPRPLVAVEGLDPRDYVFTLSFVGRLEPRTQVEMAFEIGGTVEAVHVDEGDAVSRGQVLASLDTALLRTELNQAEANLAIAEREERRSAELFKKAVVPEARRQDAASQAALARATVAGIRERIGKATLRSPIAGRVAIRDLEPRETVQPSRPVLRVVDVSAVILDLWVPDHQIARIREGQPATVAFEAFPGEPFAATVTRVAVAADTQRRLFKVELTLPNGEERLKPGLIGTARLEVATMRDVVVVPLRYSVVRDGERIVFLERDGVAERRVVSDYLIHEGSMIVRDGAALAGRLITDGMQQLTGGETVRVGPGLASVLYPNARGSEVGP
ncbi:MAG: efflux RND transporter periplasmic adaptor subunit [Myxococcales bacterium]|nr:efflux RND transporter periplasmic adaptor subunit [Myxococcales bacterium]